MADLASLLRSFAARLPDVEQGIACKGTALESVTFQVRKKAFLFVGPKAARLKLDRSLDEARRLAAKQPEIEVGTGGWVKIATAGKGPPAKVLERWVGESHALYAGTAAGSARGKAPAKRRPAPGRSKGPARRA